ncbi:probable protein phosphatase 2C 47 [Tanacetum coccineum]
MMTMKMTETSTLQLNIILDDAVSISEKTAAMKCSASTKSVRSGSHMDIGARRSNEDQHIHIDDVAKLHTTAMKCSYSGGIYILISNAGDCRVVISRKGVAKKISNDHRPSNLLEEKRVKELDGYFEDGIWDVMSNEEAMSLVQKQLMQHNDAQQCATELINQALRLHTSDNLTALVVCFSSHIEPPKP